MAAGITRATAQPAAAVQPVAAARWLLPATFGGAFLPALLLYLRTLTPGVLVGDMGEFQFTGYILGVPHPTGYPLYTLLSKLFTFLPFGNIAYRVNLSSAVYMAAAAGMIALAVLLLITRRPGDMQASSDAPLAAAVGAGCGWLFAVCGTVWDQAVLARSYALNALLVSSIVVVLLLFWIEGRRRWFLLFWLLLGLSFAHHGTTITLVPGYLVFLAICVVLYARQQPAKLSYLLRLAPLAVGGFLLGLSPYLLFAYRLIFGYTYYWGNPQTWADVIYLVRGTPFQGQVFAYPLTWDSQLAQINFGLGQILEQYGPLGIAGPLLGLLALCIWRRWPAALLLALLWLGNFIFAINYGIIGNLYLIPGYIMIAIATGSIAVPLLANGAQAGIRRGIALIGAVALLVLAGWFAADRLPLHDRSGDTAVADLAEVTLRDAAPNATVYVDWESISVLRYYQYAEHRRLDLKLESGNPDAWAEEIAADLAAGRPAYVGGFAGPAPPQAVRDGFSLEKVGLVYQVVGAK